MDTTAVIVVIVACLAAYFVQIFLLNSIYKKAGKYMNTGRLWPALSLFGFVILWGIFAFGESDTIALLLLVGVICFIPFIVLVIRNIKGAGAAMGILLTIVQTISGLPILILGFLKMLQIGSNLAGVTTTPISNHPNRAPQVKEQARKQREHDRESAEAYAEHDGFTSGQEAADAGMYSGDPDLLRKD